MNSLLASFWEVPSTYSGLINHQADSLSAGWRVMARLHGDWSLVGVGQPFLQPFQDPDISQSAASVHPHLLRCSSAEGFSSAPAPRCMSASYNQWSHSSSSGCVPR